MKALRSILTEWYRQHCRELPWRHTRDPYLIWLSEVILQQTRVAQGLDYYDRFSRKFPDVSSLAEADESEVLRLWQGLGYYSRARNLHHAARQVVEEYGAEFPGTYASLLSLKGIGPYTAAAVSSIAYGEARAVVDGNVERVLSRVFGVREPKGSAAFRKKIEALAAGLLDPADPGNSNQALMEFGALQCVPRTPDCNTCPVQTHCVAFTDGDVENLPVRAAKAKPRERYFNYLALRLESGGRISTVLRKRLDRDIWQHLYEFPMLETESPLEPDDPAVMAAFSEFYALPGFRITGITERRHVLSHQVILARFTSATAVVETGFELPEGYVAASPETLDDYPLPRLIERFLEEVFSWD